VKLLYDEAFREPKPWDYLYGTGNPALKPEKMRSVELALSHPITDNLSVGSSIYKNRITDKFALEYGVSGDRWINKDELNTMGFELYGDYSVKDFIVQADYTFTDSHDQDDAVIPEISKHTANAGITYLFNPALKINLRGNYLGERSNPFIIPNTGNDRIDAAFLLHGCVTWKIPGGISLQMKISNIFDRRYFHPSNRFAGRYRQPQRTITVKGGFDF
jgi:outer membrane receptor for ferrienterochelin and colicins